MRLPAWLHGFAPRARAGTPHSRAFSTRAPSPARWRLRSSTQRRLSLLLAFCLLVAIVWLCLPAQARLSVASCNFWLPTLGMSSQAGLQAHSLLGMPVVLPVVEGELAALSARQVAAHLLGLILLGTLARRLMRLHPAIGGVLTAITCLHAFVILIVSAGGGEALSLSQHTLGLSMATRALLLLSPVLLVFGLFLLEPAWSRRIVGCALLLAYLFLAEPVKLVAHAWLIELGGVLAMPTLFLIFGPAFDVIAVAGILSSLLALPPWRPRQSAESS